MIIKLVRQKDLFLLTYWIGIKSGVCVSVKCSSFSRCWILWNSVHSRAPLRTGSLRSAGFTVTKILRTAQLIRVFFCLNLDFVCARRVQIFVLSDFSEDELIWIVLNVEFVGLNNWFDHESFLCHCVILFEPFQLLFIDRPDIDISDFFSVEFKMLFLLTGLISLVTKDAMD